MDYPGQTSQEHPHHLAALGSASVVTNNDFAFADLVDGGKSGSAMVEDIGTQGIMFSGGTIDTTAWAFGYPVVKEYKGSYLVYCKGSLVSDTLNSNYTYRLGCDMTGGSSGGPWFQDFDENTGTGTVMLLNSYGYSNIKAMHGPKFDANTKVVYVGAMGAAISGAPIDNNVIVDVSSLP